MNTPQYFTAGMRRRARLVALLSASALIAPFGAMPALAQSADEASVDSNTIIVTAQRRSEALEDVPMTVAVIPQETLTNAGINTVRELANVTTGFQVGNSGSYPQPAIRGITTINAGAYENNVALFVDGLYQYVPQVLNMDLPNVQNIQILKGPQSTLFGRNATGGAILIDTIDPGQDWSGNIEGTYGRFKDRRARGYVAGPLSDRIGISLAGTYRKTGGYNKIASRTTPGQFDGRGLGLEQQSLRAKVKFDLTETFRATASYLYLRASDPRGVIFTPIEQVATPYTGANATRPRGLGEVAGDLFQLDEKEHEASLRLELDTGIGTLKSLTGYTTSNLATDFDSGGSYAADNYSTSVIIDKVWQEALDYNITAIDNVDLIVGGTYYNIKTHYRPDRANVLALAPAGAQAGTPISSYLKFQEIFFFRKKEAWAGYIDATWHATDRLSITAGGRYSKETQDVSAEKNIFCTVAAGCTVAGVLRPVGAITSTPYTRASSAQGSKYSKFTPRASIRYEISPRTNVYASYSKGFRSGEWNSVPPSDTDLTIWRTLGQIGQESVDAFEVGLKSGGRLSFEASAFYYDYHDLQVSATSFAPNGAAVVSLQSIPKAKVYGAEASFNYEVVDNLNIRGGATYLHARYGDRAVFIGTSVNGTAAGLGFSNNPDPIRNQINAGTMAQDLSGKQMSRAPNFTAFFGFDYEIPMGDGGLLFAANVKYTDSYVVTNPSLWGGEPLAAYTARLAANPNALPNNNANLAGTPFANRSNEQRARQPKFATVNASVTWTDPSDHYYVRVWGNNLTDQKYRQHYNPTGYSPIAEPLTFGGTVGFKFGGPRTAESAPMAAPPPPPPPPPPPAYEPAPPPPPPPPARPNERG
jgi:iron complex outermembrane receptor protein